MALSLDWGGRADHIVLKCCSHTFEIHVLPAEFSSRKATGPSWQHANQTYPVDVTLHIMVDYNTERAARDTGLGNSMLIRSGHFAALGTGMLDQHFSNTCSTLDKQELSRKEPKQWRKLSHCDALKLLQLITIVIN